MVKGQVSASPFLVSVILTLSEPQASLSGCAGGAAWGAGEDDDNAALLQAMRDKEKAALQALNDMLQASAVTVMPPLGSIP